MELVNESRSLATVYKPTFSMSSHKLNGGHVLHVASLFRYK